MKTLTACLWLLGIHKTGEDTLPVHRVNVIHTGQRVVTSVVSSDESHNVVSRFVEFDAVKRRGANKVGSWHLAGC